MIVSLLFIFYSFGIIIFFLGIQGMIFIPLTIAYELWKGRRWSPSKTFRGKVSILIPFYNEENTLRATLSSILASDYPSKEIIVINDGSTDSSEATISDFIEEGKVVYIKKTNAGKASALNRGIEVATGEVIIFTDADSLFLPDTIEKIVRWFADPSIDAVCGNDAPLRPSTPIQKFLTVTTHIGTGFVRRALSIIGALPIITGNLGAIRTNTLKEIGGFKEIWGEDLEITFRLHKYRKKIIFDPEPKVMSECPGTLGALWKQRIRWVRSYIKIAFMHKDMFFKIRYAPFSFYLPINFINMTIVPILQIVVVFLIPVALFYGRIHFVDAFEFMTYLGLLFFFIIALYSILIDRDFKDFVYLPYGLLIIPLSYFYNMVVAYSWWEELIRAEERWKKIERRRIGTIEKKDWRFAIVVMFFLIVGSSAMTYYYHAYTTEAKKMNLPSFDMGLSTHFDAWEDWRDAIERINNRPMVHMSKIIGVGAGRPEWVYFKWKSYEKYWANHQKGNQKDLLLTATDAFHKEGFKVAAIIDCYAPRYIEEHPEVAAIRFDGAKSPEQVSFMELVRGDYGRLILAMVEYISRNYPVDIINLTELSYYDYSYNPEDLASFKRFTGKDSWPLDPHGDINRDDPSIWEWRSALMEEYIEKVAEIVHSFNKSLYVDVPVSWRDFSRNGRESGLDYRRILKHADNVIVWNYFYLEDLPPSISEDLSSYLARNFPVDSLYVSIGLWGKKEHIDPGILRESIQATLKGGIRRIWITPDSLLTDEHWKAILPLLEK